MPTFVHLKNNHAQSGGSRHKQKGVALIFVLMIVAMLVALAAGMAGRLSSQFYRTTQSQGHLQAYWYSVGVEALGIVAVEKSYEDNENLTNLSQPWAIKNVKYPLDNGTVTGSIFDKQACFNLNVFNSLSVTETTNTNERHFLQNALIYLLQNTELEDGEIIESYLAEQIADSVLEFVDENDDVNTIAGVESSSYQSFVPPYNAANGLLVDDSELRTIYNVSAPMMEALDGILCAIPTNKWQLNVNTIEPEQAIILASLFQPALSVEDARQIIDNRNNDGWASVTDFLSTSELSSVSNDIKTQAQPYLGVRSQYFELQASLTAAESSIQLTSLIYSDDYKTAKVIRRSLGGVQ